MTTPTRTAIIAGNWKMHYGPRKASSFAAEIVPPLGMLLQQHPHILSILCPPTISLTSVREVLDAHLFSRLELGAQNMYFEEKGAFTGETSPTMVRELCSTVILGQSVSASFPFISIVPAGTPGNPIVYAQPLAPTGFSGG